MPIIYDSHFFRDNRRGRPSMEIFRVHQVVYVSIFVKFEGMIDYLEYQLS